MDATSIPELMKQHPFLPFEIRTSSGEVHRVKHPEMALMAGPRMVIYYPENDQMRIVSLLHVTEVIVSGKPAAQGSNGQAN